MSMQPAPSGELTGIWTWLRRFWPAIAAGIALALALGLVALAVLPKSYDSTTAVLVSPAPTSAPGGQTTLNMDTEVQLVQSAIVAQKAAEDLGQPDAAGAVAERTSVVVPPNSTVVQITYRGDTAPSAQEGARAVASAYLRARQEAAQQRLDQQVEVLLEQRRRLAADVRQLRGQLDERPADSASAERLEIDIESALRRIADIDTQVAALTTTPTTPGVVITDAQAPGAQSAPDPRLIMGSALMLGVLLGLIFAMIQGAARSRRIHEAGQLGEIVGVDHVADLGGLSTEVGAPEQPREVLRELERVLAWAGPQDDPGGGLLLVTSPTPNRAKSITAAALAEASARPGETATLVVRDPDSVVLREAENPQSEDVLVPSRTVSGGGAEATRIGQVLVHSATPAQSVGKSLTWGGGSGMVTSLRDAAQSNLVVVELAPMSDSADAYSMARLADAVIVVCADQELTSDVVDTVNQLGPVARGPIIAVRGPREG